MIRLFTRRSSGIPALKTLVNTRFLSQTNRIFDKTPASTPTQPETPAPEPSSNASPAQPWQKKQLTKQLTAFDKKVLVWTGKYKSADEIPPNVAHETIDRARDKFRVKACIYMMIACTIACIVQVVRGKRAAERGESVVNANLEWHRQYNEAANKKQ